MKKRLLLLLAGVLLLAGSAFARPVDANKARTVAETYLRAMGMKNTAGLVDVTAQTPFTEFYVFAAPEGGFIFVSGDDCVQPVLGYSVENRFNMKNMPQHVLSFLKGYEKEIKWYKSQQANAGEATGALRQGNGVQPSEWRGLLDDVAPQPPLTTSVSPLLTTTWNQRPLYNNLCPSDTNGQAVTGCVATATAQVMKYHNHPAQGYDSHTYTSSRTINGTTFTYPNLTVNFGTTTYQWSQMPDDLTSTSTTAQINAVATLMYHIGVADEMRYSPYASGANNSYGGSINSNRASSQESLARYFKYCPDMAAVDRETYSHDHYVSILRGELDQQRPILYSGSDSTGGHSFVIDGYNNSGFFHVNWGWGSYCDGYYTIGGLEPEGGGTGANMGSYNEDNVALIGIRPNTTWSPTSTTSIAAYMQNQAPTGASAMVYDRTTGSLDSVFSYGDTAVLKVTLPEGYCFTGWNDGGSFNPREILATGGNYNFTATCEPIGLGDTVGYCRGSIHSLSSYSGGVKLPASALDTTKQMTSVMFYPYTSGTYTITVYSGASHSIMAATVTYTVSSSATSVWHTVPLSTPVPATDDIWIIIENSAPDSYPVSLTTYCGVPSSFILVYNGIFYEYGNLWECSAMIKGIFGSGSAVVEDCEITAFPYTENFDDTSSYSCLRLQDANGDGVTWSLINGYGVGNSVAAYIRYAVEADDYLILPAIVTSGNYSFSWKAKAFQSNYPESYEVYIGNNMIFSETLSDTNYVTRTVSFTVAAGDTVNPKFRYISDDMYYFFLDDITISQGVSQHTITATANNSAWGTVTGGGVYNAGSTATLTAVANSGYHFVSWQDGDTNTPRIITVTGDSTFTAIFAADAAPVQQYTITVSSNNSTMGTVTGGGTYNAGTTITLTATANNGYHFVDWNDNNTTNPRMVTVTANATYTANFAADTPNPPTGDTISYCLDNPIATSINAGGASFDWGIMFPASSLTGRNYLKSVLTYVLSDETYTLRVFRGGDNMPATLVHTQSVAFDTNHLGWQEIVLDATVPLPTGQNLWVVINSTVAAVCDYTGDVNSDWLGFSNTNWIHLYEANASLTFSWLLKAVTSATQPALPAPSVTVSGPTQIALGAAATFEAAGTAGAVITWNFQGGAPAVATGTSATTTFTTPGLYNVVATITNAYGTGRDTLQVLVVDYAVGDTVSYCLDREFFTNIGTGSPAPFSWGIMLPAAYLVHRDKLDHVLLYTKVPGDYTLHLYQGGDTVPQNLIHTQVFNITDTNSGYKTLTPNTTINIDKTQNLWIVFHTDSLSYAAAAGAYADDINSSWITLNDTNWNQLADYGLVYSWLIKVVTSQEGPVTHNVTVVSIMNDGTDLDPAVCTVTGADAYAEGSTVTLTAASSDPTIKFLFWITSSGDTILDNPYIFPIHSDVTLIAVFDHTEGISGIRNERCNIYPNPAHDFVVIDGVEGQGQVTITDITGRQVARFEVRNGRTEFDVSRLGTGQYFVRIVADCFNTMKKLIVE